MSNYDPTCPYTGEPVSDILIPNEHCNRLLPILLESGAVTLEDGELEAWKAKRQNVERLKKQNKEKKMISSEDVTAVVSSQSGSAQTPTLPCADTVYITGPLLEREELDLGLVPRVAQVLIRQVRGLLHSSAVTMHAVVTKLRNLVTACHAPDVCAFIAKIASRSMWWTPALQAMSVRQCVQIACFRFVMYWQTKQ
jgi:hypothetical protein